MVRVVSQFPDFRAHLTLRSTTHTFIILWSTSDVFSGWNIPACGSSKTLSLQTCILLNLCYLLSSENCISKDLGNNF